MFNPGGTGPDPFVTDVDLPGVLTHGHLAENRNHGGVFAGLADPRKLFSAPAADRNGRSGIRNFVYGRGDLLRVGKSAARRRPARRLAEVRQPRRAAAGSCTRSRRARRPVTARPASPIRWPTARCGATRGNLGYGPGASRAAANRATWPTPRNLKTGTYTYFCKIHPFMRGAFRVKDQRARR